MAKNKNKNLYKIGGVWYFRIQWAGQSIRRSLDTTKETTARDLRDELLANLRQYGQLGRPESEPKTKANDELTFGDVVKKWVPIHKAEVKYTTWRDYKSAMNCYVLPKFKDRPIKDISYMEILDFRNKIEVSPKRANNIMVPMKAVFDMAYKEGIVSDNVMRKVKRLREETPDINPFSYEEIKQILRFVDPWYLHYVVVAFFSGMRDGELNGLRWGDYHPKMSNGPELHIRRSYVYGKDSVLKTKKSVRNIQCLPEVVEALKQQKSLTGGSEYIFLTKDGNRMNPDHFRNVAWKPALEKAGIEYRPAIQTRHTFATMMLSSGEDFGWVQKMMGHSSPQMIYQRYYSWIPQKTRSDGKAFRIFAEEADLSEEKEGQAEENKIENGGVEI